MNKTEKNNLLRNIRDNMHNEIVRVLTFLKEEMKGHEIKIISNLDTESCTSDFLHNENLLVNISYVKFPEYKEGSYYIGIYKLFEPKEFEINILIETESKLRFLIPKKLRDALIESHAESSDLEIIL